ncbi:MAG: hypothetical protein SGPRY_010974, partial [Prymnesium sp.]
HNGTIVHVSQGATLSSAAAYAAAHGLALEDLAEYFISPGLIDAHVHISAVGGRGWEGYATATRAAAAGGVTSILGMPLNSLPPTVSVEALEMEASQMEMEGIHVDVGLWGGVVPSSLTGGQLEKLLADGRVLGVKAFLSPLPPAAGYEAVSPEELHAVGRAAAKASLPLLVHCELMSTDEMATLNVDGLRAHVVHLSDAGSISLILKAKAQFAEEIPDGETRLKLLGLERKLGGCPRSSLLFGGRSALLSSQGCIIAKAA